MNEYFQSKRGIACQKIISQIQALTERIDEVINSNSNGKTLFMTKAILVEYIRTVQEDLPSELVIDVFSNYKTVLNIKECILWEVFDENHKKQCEESLWLTDRSKILSLLANALIKKYVL